MNKSDVAATPAKAEDEAKVALTSALGDVNSTGATWAGIGKPAVNKWKAANDVDKLEVDNA